MNEDVTANLVRALIEHMRKAPEDWESMSMILGFDSEGVNRVTGFVYDDVGAYTSVTASPYDIGPVVKTYTDSRYQPEEPLPVSMLLQFDKTSGECQVTFEDNDAGRWRLTPDTWDSLPEGLRPDFD
ncbi:hypothetical protein [Leucobacter tenebrionis]|uniref:hypothetical protein n=1 Tax=Leucobacter tenebrionis TaxID=2873270 RepID=UPI001CA7751B|nr:hypothetical protein [Leucobacter tenebrionis]QZY51940.1 hypothetical protein KVY00_00115 [Leucobacter tenebrionis]